ncbi:MAG: amino acid adenylation domain-containing protein [Candidatus Aminicenantes bacterium]|nr:amino acid adenylation domain-containing protein [Candidatus Aminicenantes bacterium]NIM82453.1 amino acid adenylation domain-containing protein [Candidatus Aminicenantes bacterium]NIN21814.1 amino acid adenylation domain-containing protein [Candidatus Aminicenantes bacterium]NIN45606.1 amino acid adenylation domain-containing protein [Candidatus Aminicenantes bacterium]NIN88437.1 amino acid adenylation domain-containing protein [Candidatus Aminicenantes bacterium]
MGIEIDKNNIEDVYSMSDIQKGMVYHSLKDAHAHVYHNQTVYQWKDNEFDSETLKKALMLMVEKHPILRTGFQVFDFEEPIQILFKRISFDIQHNDLSHLDKPEQNEYINKALEDDRQRPFNLSDTGPVWRIKTFTLGNGDICLVWICHHAIMDGWSSASFATELYNTYSMLKIDPNFVPVKLKSTYKDFVIEQDVEKRKTENIEYWRKELQDYKRLDFPGIPTDSIGINRGRYEGRRKYYSKKLGDQLFDELNNTVKKLNTSIKNICFGAYIHMLNMLTYENDLVVGLITHNRPVCKDGDKILGCFLNTVPFRMKIPMNITWSAYMKLIDNKLRELSKYNKFSLLEIVKIIGDESKDKNPILDTIFTFTDFHVYNQLDEGNFNNTSNTLSLDSQARTNTLFDFFVTITSGEFRFAASYTDYIISDKLVADLFVCFENVLNNFISRPGIRIDNKDVMPVEEKQKLLNYFNDTKADYPREKTIHELFERQVEKIPDDKAVLFGKTALTYRELNEESNQLARILKKQGIRAEGIAAMLMERSIEMIIGILAILKAGGAYLPIDPEYPDHRIQFMLEDSGSKTLLTSQKIKLPLFYEGNKIIINDGEIQKAKRREEVSNLANINSPTDLAYIIYTSGTTGHPKGVMIEHRNVVRLMVNDKNVFHLSRFDVWTMFHSYCFDFSVWEMYGALLYGGKLIVIPGMEARDPGKFLKILKQEKVTILNQTPSAFYNLIDEEIKYEQKDLKIRYVIFGGEALKPAKLKPWKLKYPGTQLVNMFGITETTVHVTYKEITDKEIEFDISNIGKPIPTTCCYVLDSHRKLLPVGVAGELCVGGDGVGRGYLKRDELTREKFIKNPFKTGERLYRSGDLVRMLENGEMEYLGRLDHQVQLRGFRIELGEIESRLIKCDEIDEAVVIARENEMGDKYLCAYYASNHELDVKGLREYIAKELPSYMIPSYFVHLEKIPLTPNGKIDRKALPDISGIIVNEFIEPRNELEKELVDIWRKALEIEKVGINSSFFELGGDSIRAIRLISQLNKQLDTDISIADLYTHETIEMLSNKIYQSKNEKADKVREKVLKEIADLKAKVLLAHRDAGNIEDVYPMTAIQQGTVFDYIKGSEFGVYHGQFLYPKVCKDFDPGRFKRALTLVVKRHEILRTGFNVDDFEDPIQIVYKTVPLNFNYTDISHLARKEQEEYVKEEMKADLQRPFNEKISPLWRMHVFIIDQDNVILLFVCHHAILDGWSKASLMVELHNTYLELETNPGFIREELKCTNRDVVIEEIIEKKYQERDINYWKNELEDYQRLDFSIFCSKRRKKGLMKVHYREVLDPDFLKKLENTAQKYNTSLRSLAFGAYVYTLNMMFYENEITAGCVTNNRPLIEDGEKVFGCFLNTIPVRIKIIQGIRWSDYISLVEDKMAEVKGHDRIFLSEIVKVLGETTKDKSPFFDTIFNFVNFYVYGQLKPQEHPVPDSIQQMSIYRESNSTTNTLFDVELSITYGRIRYHARYSSDMEEELAVKFCTFYERVLNKFINEPERMIKKDEIITDEERQRLLYDFNDTKKDIVRDRCYNHIFEENTAKFQNKIAVVHNGSQRTYKELNESANRIAHYLITQGIEANDIVGIFMKRGINMLASIIGVFKAGAAYLPLEVNYPQERIKNILEDSNTKLLITEMDNLEIFDKIQKSLPCLKEVLCLENSETADSLLSGYPAINPGINSNTGFLAYMIYTSGTMGKPKGVMIHQLGMINHLYAKISDLSITERDIVAQTASACFDISIWQFLGVLLVGGKVCVIDREIVLNPQKLLEELQAEKVTIFESVPSLMKIFLEMVKQEENRGLNDLRWMIPTGESLGVSLVREWYERYPVIKLMNAYGPTECSDDVTHYVINELPSEEQITIPIGKPLQNLHVHILDKNLSLCPIGVQGEICVAGIGVGRGYKDPAATERYFVPNPYFEEYKDSDYATLYRTGDIGYYREDGLVECLGRLDYQVKIRGNRIELGEIERVLLGHNEVKEAVVLVRENESGNKYICAYIIGSCDIEQFNLKNYLKQELPDYMIPEYVVQLEKIPLTPNGKIDRKALPEPEFRTSEEYIGPRNLTEMRLVEIWADILNVNKDKISIDADFFEMGGHSLRATILVNRIHKVFNVEIPIREIFTHQTVSEMGELIDNSEKSIHSAIRNVEKREYYPVSPAQKRLLILNILEQASTNYNISGAVIIEGDLDYNCLENVFKTLISRHEAFRTSFFFRNEEPVQQIHDDVPFSIEYIKKDTEEGERRQETGKQTQHRIKEFIRPFALDKASLLRIGLIEIEKNRHILIFDMHHIITDGTSYALLVHEFIDLYCGKELPWSKIEYKDFSVWQNELLKKGIIEKQKEYWLNIFKGDIPVLELPVDYPRPAVQSYEGATYRFEIGEDETAGLYKAALEENVTLFIVLLAAYNILLSKLSNEEDIIIGTPIAGRRHADLNSVIGMFVNTLALRNFPSGDKSFRDFLKEVRESTITAFDHQDYQFEDLIEQVMVTRDTGRSPLFDVMFVLQNMDFKEETISGLIFKSYEFESVTSRFDLLWIVMESENKLFILVEYCTRLFKRITIERFSRYLKNIISYIIEDSARKLSEIDIITEEEKMQLLCEFNDTRADYPVDKTIHELFEKQAKKTPDKIALSFTDRQISYENLNSNSNKLASRLRRRGIKQDTIVGLMVKRRLEVIVGILGILKAGGAYLPVDPEFPDERKKYILENSNVFMLLINYELAPVSIPDNIEIIDIRDVILYPVEGDLGNLPYENSIESLLYLIYTSGSTGKPKGAMLEHKNLVNLIQFQYHHTGIDFSIVLQFASISFDVSFQEIFSTLLYGGKLILINEDTRKNVPELFNCVEINDIKTLFLPTSFLKFLINESNYIDILPENLKHIVTAGEQLIITERFKDYLKTNNVYLYNHYGPSETHVVTALTLSPGEEIPEIPSIGKPVKNTKIYILDKEKKLQPLGVIGEIYIGGDQVGRGYFGKSELTAKRFIPDPFAPGKKIYKTGDIGKWLPDGNIEFLGRNDFQVKVRGYRIELGEIENQLINHSEINQAVVIVKEGDNHNRYLCAYYVSSTDLAISEIRSYLSSKLPDYMLPYYFVPIERLPLTPSKKVDRKALPEPEFKAGTKYIKPRNQTEMKLVEIWSDILNIEKTEISIDANFFELGGHSLKATILVARIHQKFDVEIPMMDIFSHQTVREQGELIHNSKKSIYSLIKNVEKREYYPVSPAQKRLVFLNLLDQEATNYNMPRAVMIEGDLDNEHMEKVFKALLWRHEVFRTSFKLVDDEPVQYIRDNVHFSIDYKEINTPGNEQEADNQVGDLIKEFITPFDLSKAPLLRASLLPIEEDRHLLICDMHHIISDGTSIAIFIGEFIDLYNGKQLDLLKVQYKDFSTWQNELLNRGTVEKQKEYWLNIFKGVIPVLELPLDYPRPLLQSNEGMIYTFEIGKEETAGLKRIALQEGITLFIVLLAAYNILFSKLSNQEDIIIGTPIAGRKHADLESLIGMFVNTAALRNYPARDKSFKDFLEEVKENTIAAFDNQEYQFEDLIENVNVNRDMGRNPIFDVMVVLQNTDFSKKSIPGLTFKPYEFENSTSKFDLLWEGIETENNLFISIQYCTKLFKRSTIERFSRYLKNIVSSIIENSVKKLAKVEIITEEEKREILCDFNDTQAEYPENKPLHELFEEQTGKTPGNIAVTFNDEQLTYKELNNRSDQLAHLMRKRGIKADEIIGIMMKRSLEMMIGIFSVLKAGGAYMPIDPGYPQERIKYILEDSGTKLVLTRKQSKEKVLDTCESVDLKNLDLIAYKLGNLENKNTKAAENLAYVIYTSGSTGNPKGVLIDHYSVVNRLNWMQKQFPIDDRDTLLQKTSFTFDVSVWEIFWWALVGAKVCMLIPGGEKDPARIADTIARKKVSIIHFVPSMLTPFMEFIKETGKTKSISSLRQVIASGEALTLAQVTRLNELLYNQNSTKLANLYGPTEAAVDVSFFDCSAREKLEKVPIGKPIDNIQLFIVDRGLDLQPVGVPGELCISGVGVGRGYLNNIELTLKKFVESPFEAGKRMYKTGDFARWLPDGNIEFLGRSDFQVKIRGFRVEPGEIESQLLKHEKIEGAVVLTREENQDKHLCAYIVSEENLKISDLKGHLTGNLPGYMIPSLFIKIEKIPLTPNGKVDRKALLSYDTKLGTGKEYIPPKNKTEKIIAGIWKEVLNFDKVSIYDNIFDLGGDSIKIIKINSKIRQILKKDIPILSMFRFPTIKSLSGFLNMYETGDIDKTKSQNLSEVEETLKETVQLFDGL